MKIARIKNIGLIVFLVGTLFTGCFFNDSGLHVDDESPYDLRGLTIDPGSNEPDEYENPGEEDLRHLDVATRDRALPVAPRMIAEWEPVQGALIRYPLGISVNCVKTIASELTVYVLCAKNSQNNASSTFQSGGVNMANIKFITAVTDTYWTRDYAPWWITTGNSGSRVVRPVDVIYRMDGERPNDDKVPVVLAGYFNLPTYYPLNFVCQGGNVMTDSFMAGASTDRLNDENPGKSTASLQQMAKSTTGFDPYYIMPDPAYPDDYIKHIDCWAKLISPTTVLVKRVPGNDPDYSKFESAAADWANRTNAAGVKYNVIRVDGPGKAPYVNHVILNDRVLVPIMTSETNATDKKALDQIRAAYGTSYRVIGVTSAPGLEWLRTDSIHCRVNSIPVFTANDPVTPLVITASAGANGSISPSGNVTVNKGSSQTFSITPAQGYSVASVTVDGGNKGAITSYTFSNVQANHTISASFQSTIPTTYVITASAGANGSISPSGNVTANPGGSQTFTITPASGYLVASVTVDGVNKGAITSYTFSNVQANHTISASFQQASSTDTVITLNQWVDGSITANTTKWYYFNTTGGQQYSISWDDAYQGSGKFTGNDIVISGYRANKTTAYFVNVDSGYNTPQVITAAATEYVYLKVVGYTPSQAANFSLKVTSSNTPTTYIITASAGAHGSISPSGNVTVDKGSSQTFTITPAPGYSVDSLTVDGANIGAFVSHTFTNIQAAHSISVAFKAANADNLIPLKQWVADSIAANETKWYYFNATGGKQYTIYWDDAFEGSGKYSGNDIVVSGYQANKTSTYFYDVDSGYNRPKTITAAATEIVYIKVVGYTPSQAANFSLKVTSSTISTRSVVFKAVINNKYVCAENSGSSPLIATSTGGSTLETFYLITNTDGTVSLKAKANGKYVCAENDGSSPLIANKSSISGNTEKFSLITNANGTVSLKSKANGKYVCAENAGSLALIANRTAIGTWEQFSLENK